MRLDCGEQIRVEACDEIVVVLLLGRVGEGGPRQLVDVPGVVHFDIGEDQRHGALRFGEGSDEEVGSQRDGGGDGGLVGMARVLLAAVWRAYHVAEAKLESAGAYLAMDYRVLSEENDLGRGRDHEGGHHRAGHLPRRWPFGVAIAPAVGTVECGCHDSRVLLRCAWVDI